MYNPKAKHSCSVVGCTDTHVSLHRLPTKEDTRAKWLNFIFQGNVPASLSKSVVVCANHFTPDCFSNQGQYQAGLATRLLLKDGSIPTVHGNATEEETQSTSVQQPVVHHVACQTDQPVKCTVGTQLSMRTLRPHFRSTGTQKSVSCAEVGVGTSNIPLSTSQPFLSSTPIKRPCKRARLELEEEEEEEDPLEGSSFMDIPDPKDSTYNPEESVTVLSESVDVTLEPSCPVHKTPTYIVYEKCLMELFEVCPVCRRVSDVQTRRIGTFLSVEQTCPHCQFFRKWNSQPVLGSTPAGNLQLSAAVYTTGASFFKLEKIFRAMQLKMFQYDTFRRHARSYIEPAIIHTWKTVQDGMMEQLSQQESVILGGDLRADSPGHSAKFGSYSMMDLRSNTIVDIQLVQSNKVGGSYHMEKEGLKRSLALLEARGVALDSIVTDRHPQIQKFLREAKVTQYYDVWHIEKVPPTDVIISEWASNSFECVTEANPDANFTWKRSDNSWPQSAVRVEGASLQILSMTSHLNGLYQCEASNPYGTKRSHLYLHVSSGCTVYWTLLILLVILIVAVAALLYLQTSGKLQRIREIISGDMQPVPRSPSASDRADSHDGGL
ncbi:uncharacterized protein LOC119025295 isoform X2 [Acanthopagrus latus]|uniref:uncharacterized protein LOC119025295 isoform X2 n=1 Tax=Acanthopagrus latus TaxID=8177 RepID=UPI00187C2612|nr:uncharacterized protein LOC119025295 isoform X2 [Acanthopagrus latus]